MQVVIIVLMVNFTKRSEVLSNLVWGRSCHVSHVMLADINKKYKLHIYLNKIKKN